MASITYTDGVLKAYQADAPDIGRHIVSTTVFNVIDYGAVGDGTANDTAAVQATITAAGLSNGVVYLPAGLYKITSTLTISGKSGFIIEGDGPLASQIVWRGSDGGADPILKINGCQLFTIRDISFTADYAPAGGTRPSACIHVSAAGGISSYGHLYSNIACNGTGTDDLFDYGIHYTSDGSGNNSEVTYFKVDVQKAKEACYQIEGDQAKGHNFFQCVANVSKYGLRFYDAGASSTTGNWYGGNIGTCTVAGVSIDAAGEPMLIESVDSEQCYVFFTFGDGVTPRSAAQPVIIRNCRLDCSSTTPTPAFSTWIRYSGGGPFVFENNVLYAGADIPRIAIATDGFSGHITDNTFSSTNSVATSPLNWAAGSVGPSSQVKMARNLYLNGLGDRAYRADELDTNFNTASTGFYIINPSGTSDQYLLVVPMDKFIAAALTQTISFPIPQAIAIRGMALYNNNKLALGGAPDIDVKIGSTSGGDEYLLDTRVSTTDTQFYTDPTTLGTNLTTDYFPGFGFVPDYFGASTIYVTMTSSAGNLGTGAVTNLTGGPLMLVLVAGIAPRWLQTS